MRAMHSWRRLLPTLTTIGAAGGLLLYGPLHQSPGYNDFADRSMFFGLPHAADVLSNIGFAGVGIWGLALLHRGRNRAAIGRGSSGYHLFLIGLVMTAAGSGFYHLVPDNDRLVWDRVPIALACAGLLAAVRAETHPQAAPTRDVILLGGAAVLSVVWWSVTDSPAGTGDLRPYVLMQGLPLFLIPLWQSGVTVPRRDRVAFGLAIALYVAAKAAEFSDHALFRVLGILSGHSLKHVLAAAAAAVIVGRLRVRIREAPADGSDC